MHSSNFKGLQQPPVQPNPAYPGRNGDDLQDAAKAKHTTNDLVILFRQEHEPTVTGEIRQQFIQEAVAAG